jgi:SAM-dependent methyltransferase
LAQYSHDWKEDASADHSRPLAFPSAMTSATSLVILPRMTASTLDDVAACWEGNAETWTRHSRAGYDVYRDHNNTPAFLAMLPSVSGLQGLDIGCGEGSNTRLLAERGARMHAIDVAPTFVKYADAAGGGITYQVASGTSLPFDDESFDFATAFMSLMDMPDHDLALREAFRVLRPSGFLQFSILHPCFNPPKRRTVKNTDGIVVAVQVADYFESCDGRIEEWRFGAAPADERAVTAPFRVPRFHRTLSNWLNLVIASGFAIEELGEPIADESTAEAFPAVADTRVTPLFLHVRVRKGTRYCQGRALD